MILIIAVAIIMAFIFLLINGYNFKYIKLAFGQACFKVEEYKFCPSNKFKVIMIQNKNEKFSYLNGFDPVFSKDNSNSFVMLKEINRNNLIVISLGKYRNPSMRDGCLKSTECLYSDTILFGKPAYSVITSKLPDLKFIVVPSLEIEVSSGLIDDNILNEINISKHSPDM